MTKTDFAHNSPGKHFHFSPLSHGVDSESASKNTPNHRTFIPSGPFHKNFLKIWASDLVGAILGGAKSSFECGTIWKNLTTVLANFASTVNKQSCTNRQRYATGWNWVGIDISKGSLFGQFFQLINIHLFISGIIIKTTTGVPSIGSSNASYLL